MNAKDSNKDSGTPKWETFVLAISFVLLWAWWLARQAAYKAEVPLNIGWQFLLLGTVVALVVVFVRRTKRTVDALREQHPARRGGAERN